MSPPYLPPPYLPRRAYCRHADLMFLPLPAPPPYLPRRAYCRHADLMFPPVWLALACALCAWPALPTWLLLLLLPASFMGGVLIFGVLLAGAVTPGHLRRQCHTVLRNCNCALITFITLCGD